MGFSFYYICAIITALQRFISYQQFNKPDWTLKALDWAQHFSHFAYYQHNNISYPHNGFRQILAIGAKRTLSQTANGAFENLRAFHQNKWLFGYLGYDLKNDTERLTSENTDHVQFPDISFFEAEHIIFFGTNGVEIHSDNESLFEEISKHEPLFSKPSFSHSTPAIDQDTYEKTVAKLIDHIEAGDIYEINFCQEFHGKVESFSPLQTYLALNELSPKPFSCFQRFNEHYIICASPERFLLKEDDKLISQPIKGTRPRGADSATDELLISELRNDEKEIAENMMIVDLVRNDLAKSSKSGSVKVEELFGIYSFQQVHQMISTVISEKKETVDFVECIKNAFPMGSMTGAPKVMVMKLIEHYEQNRRGAFSGAAGYISPSGNFDFNVLIRSLFINAKTDTYSFQVGSAITYDAVPSKEYEECLVKAKALLAILTANN
ncbi:para-aminobenzoate synthetase component 1 [Roseivirga pacifica]|uniref:Para-aminobenzoate synthetase component 1 n=1 Tax=Roseivirga pacifica TaxID=1267423 RepID=A0A1I0QTQ0_9BACT|nr:anthranilate synthase component I family protein [Roseivirga pacifica]RKQ42557.1 para-aminobenzoate synthetase component 1 [Roseivirga pacifica]SEW31002.1 para-aminobenzoate synthetase component 1 [Roseivirga pacifica]